MWGRPTSRGHATNQGIGKISLLERGERSPATRSSQPGPSTWHQSASPTRLYLSIPFQTHLLHPIHHTPARTHATLRLLLLDPHPDDDA